MEDKSTSSFSPARPDDSGRSGGESFDSHKLLHEIGAFLPVGHEHQLESQDSISLINHFVEIAEKEYKSKEQKVGKEVLAQLERFVYLRAIDTLWQEHLDTMEHLRDSVRLRGYGQRDPLQEFKNEGFSLFQRLLDEINKQVVYTIFRVDVAPQPAVSAQRSALSADIGRNDPCPCGSGKKWKKCGLLNTQEHQAHMAKKA